MLKYVETIFSDKNKKTKKKKKKKKRKKINAPLRKQAYSNI